MMASGRVHVLQTPAGCIALLMPSQHCTCDLQAIIKIILGGSPVMEHCPTGSRNASMRQDDKASLALDVLLLVLAQPVQ